MILHVPMERWPKKRIFIVGDPLYSSFTLTYIDESLLYFFFIFFQKNKNKEDLNIYNLVLYDTIGDIIFFLV